MAASRSRWQYCQIETRGNDTGVLKQFIPDRAPVETELHQNWPAMLGKLGEQGWELVGVLTREGGLGKLPVTYVLKRELGTASGAAGSAPIAAEPPVPAPPAPPDEPPEPPKPKSPSSGFDPLRGP